MERWWLLIILQSGRLPCTFKALCRGRWKLSEPQEAPSEAAIWHIWNERLLHHTSLLALEHGLADLAIVTIGCHDGFCAMPACGPSCCSRMLVAAKSVAGELPTMLITCTAAAAPSQEGGPVSDQTVTSLQQRMKGWRSYLPLVMGCQAPVQYAVHVASRCDAKGPASRVREC